MQLFDVILIGIALSIDACALTIANCATYGNSISKKKEWLMPILFALFQGVMPLIGYFVGYAFKGFIGTFTKYLSAGIFFVLALKIIIDIIKDAKSQRDIVEVGNQKKPTDLTLILLLIQALATSIDALAIGVTLIDLSFSVFIAVLIISFVTLALVTLALLFGKYLGKLFGKYAEWVGAIILLILSIKALIEAIAH